MIPVKFEIFLTIIQDSPHGSNPKNSRWGTTSWIIIVFFRLFLLGHSSSYEWFTCKFWKNLGRRMSCNFDFKFALQRQLFEKRSVCLRCFCNRTCHVFLSMFEYKVFYLGRWFCSSLTLFLSTQVCGPQKTFDLSRFFRQHTQLHVSILHTNFHGFWDGHFFIVSLCLSPLRVSCPENGSFFFVFSVFILINIWIVHL